MTAMQVWAKRRGIYSNVLGYLGGINWALMLAFVQTLFPLSNPSMLILKFFKVRLHQTGYKLTNSVP